MREGFILSFFIFFERKSGLKIWLCFGKFVSIAEARGFENFQVPVFPPCFLVF